MTLYRMIVLCGLLLCALGGCRVGAENSDAARRDTPTPVAITTAPAPSGSEIPGDPTGVPSDALWLPLSGCMPPCWQDLVPGVTSADEVQAMLQARPGVRGLRLYPVDSSGPYAHSSLTWTGSGYSAEAKVFRDSDKLDAIDVGLMSEVGLTNVRATFGDPTHLYLRMDPELAGGLGRSDMAFTLTVVYLNYGFALFSGGLFFTENAERALDEISYTRMVLFQPDNVEAFSLAYLTWPDPGPYLVPWEAGRTMRDYCLAAYADTPATADCPPDIPLSTDR